MTEKAKQESFSKRFVQKWQANPLYSTGAVLILMFFTVVTAFGNTEFGRNCQSAIAESNLLSSIYNNNIICDVYLDLTDKL